MGNSTNHFTSAYTSAFPKNDLNGGRSSTSLTQFLIRKAVEQAEWLIEQKKKDIDDLVQDKIQLEGADQISDDKLVIICARYGAARGGIHNDDLAADRITERMINLDQEIEMCEDYIADHKEAFKKCTGDTFTPKVKAAKKPSVDPDRAAAVMAKYKVA
tara:strand:- start:84 stop:560 length:477 start_codon:yes stop_codon:yes gene_type:complete